MTILTNLPVDLLLICFLLVSRTSSVFIARLCSFALLGAFLHSLLHTFIGGCFCSKAFLVGLNSTCGLLLSLKEEESLSVARA